MNEAALRRTLRGLIKQGTSAIDLVSNVNVDSLTESRADGAINLRSRRVLSDYSFFDSLVRKWSRNGTPYPRGISPASCLTLMSLTTEDLKIKSTNSFLLCSWHYVRRMISESPLRHDRSLSRALVKALMRAQRMNPVLL